MDLLNAQRSKVCYQLMIKRLKYHKLVLDWSSQVHGLRLIKNLLSDNSPHAILSGEAVKVSTNFCEKLVEGLPKPLTQVIRFI